jgi:Plasma-membrane choline transporter
MVDLSIAANCSIPGSNDKTFEHLKTSVPSEVDGSVKVSHDFHNEIVVDNGDGSYGSNRENNVIIEDPGRTRRHYGSIHTNIDPQLQQDGGGLQITGQNNNIITINQPVGLLSNEQTSVTEDARADDEEEDTVYSGRAPADDPYVYSDDSASLSDAYFFPQPDDDFGRVSRYRNNNDETDSLTSGRVSPIQVHHQPPLYPLATYYGSISNSSHLHNNYHQNPLANQQLRTASGPYHLAAIEQRAASPLWISAGSIQEDSEEIIPMHPSHIIGQSWSANEFDSGFLLPPNTKVLRKEKRRHGRQPKRNGWTQQQEQKQREKQINRERLVNQVRGRPQNSRARDVVWAYIFVSQLFAVCSFAVYYSFTTSLQSTSSTSMSWTSFLPNPASGSFFHGPDETIQRPKVKEVIPILPVLVQNETTNELQYNENLLKNETAKSINQSKNPMSTITVVSSINAEVTESSTFPTNEPFLIDYQNSLALLSVSGFFALVLAYVAFGLILVLSRAVIQIMLIFSVILALAWGVIGLSLDPYGAISVLGFAVLLQTLGYAIYHWQRVPFAATNLNTALSALRCTTDIAFLGFGCLLVSFAWIMTWSVAFIGIVNSLSRTGLGHNQHLELEHISVCILMLFSFHWTNTVIKNILRVTVATVIGTWWFYPGDIGCICTAAVAKPLWRAITKSLGSICIGSLVVQPAQLFAKIGSCICYRAGNNANGCLAGHSHLTLSSQNVKHNNAVVQCLASEEEETTDGENNLCFRCCTLYDHCHSHSLSYNRWSFTYIGMCKWNWI